MTTPPKRPSSSPATDACLERCCGTRREVPRAAAPGLPAQSGLIRPENAPERLETDHYQQNARRLLKEVRSGSIAAAERFQTLRSLADRSVTELTSADSTVRLKHALAVVAMESGYGSWLDLKRAKDPAPEATSVTMYTSAMSDMLNAWFTDYESACAAHQRHGGFLLPFKSQYFICSGEGIRLLGLDPADADWKAIGHDWIRPADSTAWERLAQKRLDLIDSEK